MVKSEKETTKVQIVHDTSARSGGILLNECLHTGPSFNQKILDVLLRFHLFQSQSPYREGIFDGVGDRGGC